MGGDAAGCHFQKATARSVRSDCTSVWGIGLASLQGGVEGRLANLEPCGGLADVQPIGQVLPCPLQLVVGDDRLAPSFAPTSGGSSQPHFGATTDQVALELPQGTEHMEDRPPTGRGDIDGFGQRPEPRFCTKSRFC